MLLKSGESTEDAWSFLLEGWRHDSPSKSIILQQQTGPPQKHSRKWRSSVPAAPIGWPALFLMSFSPRRKSPTVGSDILFHFVLLSVMCRVGAWRSKSEWREEGVGDHDVFGVVQRRESWGRTRGWSLMRVATWIFLLRVFFFGEGACSCVLEMILLSLAVHCTIPPFCLFRRGVDLSQSPLKWESIHKNPFSSFSLFLE